MSSDSDAFLQQLRATFRVEAEEHLQAITAGLLQLEQAPPGEAHRRVVETVFRAAHSLKGAACAVDFKEVESACQGLEDTFAAWKRKESAPTPQALDQVHARLTRVSVLLAGTGGDRRRAAGPYPPAVPMAPLFMDSVRPPFADSATPQFADSASPLQAEADPAGRATGQARASVRVPVEALDAQLLEAEEMLAVKLLAGQRVEDLRELTTRVQAWRREAAPAEDTHAHEQLKAIERTVATLARTAEEDRDAVAKLVDQLLVNAKKLLMLPFASMAAPLPKLVRDLCREEGKQADLKIAGEHIALDKQILDALKDPLIHLLRNCIAHGVEDPAERVRRGKPARAQLAVTVSQLAGNKVQVTVADDGCGIATDKLKAVAVQQGVLSAEAAASLPEAEAQALVFRSGVSTSPLISELAGRGLGLAIVQEKAAQLGGTVSVESRPGASTVFRVVVPAMRATFRGILVEAAGRLLVLPTLQVERVGRARRDEIRSVDGRETLSLQGRVVPLVRLADVLEIDGRRPSAQPANGTPLVVLGRGEQCVAFAVDQVLEEQEFLVKPFARPLVRVRNVSAATVLPNGRIAFILHLEDLLRSARRLPATASSPLRPAPPPGPGKSILVAEDSITSRMLIKGVLEAAGYRVTVAPDGLDAFSRLRAGHFDLLVSDVEMPRLNGFDLTARIRADRRLAELPVVLVTTLERREDRERGVDAGASAYIVKSSFDQSTLVDAVKRLL